MNRTLKVVLTGACGKIAYSLLTSLCSGYVFSVGFDLDLRLIDFSTKYQELTILKEQLDDCCFSHVSSISIYTQKDKERPFEDIDVGIFLGGLPRKPGMQRNEVYEVNAENFQTQGQYLDKVAKKTCISLVIANPTCTNCMVLSSNAPSIPKENFTALTRLDYNRFLGQIAKLLGCRPQQVKNIFVWGNHSRKQFWDASRIEVQGLSKEFVLEKLKSLDTAALEKEMYERGGFIQEKTKGNAHLSATKAITDHLKEWFQGSGRTTSMGVVLNTQKYGVSERLCFSMPTRCLGGGKYQILDLQVTAQQRKRILQNRDELLKEKGFVAHYLPADD